MSTITHAPAQKALQQLVHLSADEEAQRLAFVRERALRDEASFLRAARDEGRLQARREVARRLALQQADLDDAGIARITALSEDEVRELRGSVDSAAPETKSRRL